jgi:hypothetical protein
MQLIDTKDVDGQETLLHFLVAEMRSRFPSDQSDFTRAMHHVGEAARVAPEILAKTLAQMKQNVNTVLKEIPLSLVIPGGFALCGLQLETVLKTYQKQESCDRFVDAMTPFLQIAKEKVTAIDSVSARSRQWG